MRILKLTDPVPAEARGAAVAIGNFDGVHLGHQRVIAETRALAASLGIPSAVMTFEPHPRRLFQPDAPPFRLSSLASKARVLESLGVDLLYVATFDRAFAQIPAEAFIDDILVGRLGVRHVVVGEDFAFGHRRQGDVALLRAKGEALLRAKGKGGALLRAGGEAAGFAVTPAPQVTGPGGAVISSNTIRAALRAGDPATAAALLGRPWEIEGTVVHGDARGRELGFPTANIDLGDHLQPATGVYAVRACVGEEGPDGGPLGPLDGGPARWHDGAASFGLRPQFEGTDLRLEVYLMDFDGDLYGRTLRVRFHAFLRGERKFADVDALVAQMARDVAESRAALSSAPS